jgi:GNAT superfamily N-acetyltransferase
MPLVTTRPYTVTDEGAVSALLDELWGHDNSMRRAYAIHREWHSQLLRQTLVAEKGGAFAGVGTLLESTFHPQHLMMALHVPPAFQRQGVGSLLFKALHALSDMRPWVVRVTPDDEAGQAFLGERGFEIATRTLTGHLPTGDPALSQWAASLPPAEVTPWDGSHPARMAHLFEALYARFHQWSPPRTLSDEEAVERFLGEAVYPWSVITATRAGEPVGVGCLLDVDDAALMVFVGALSPQHDDVTPGLVRWLVQAATERDLPLSFEADEVMRSQWALYGAAPARERGVSLHVMVGPHNT